MTESDSVSFDRAADFYDATRPLPDEVTRAVRVTILDALRKEDTRLRRSASAPAESQSHSSTPVTGTQA